LDQEANENLHRALNEHAAVVITDVRGRITHVNSKCCYISGYTRGELIGKSYRVFHSGHHSRVFYRQISQTLNSGSVWHGEIQERAKGGRFYWLYTTIVPFYDETGRVMQYVAIRTDITARKGVALAKDGRVSELEAMSVALAQAEVVAEAAAKIKSEFLANMNHELRTPLTSILGYSELLTSPDQDDQNREECIKAIRRNGYHLLAVINDLIDVSSIDSGRASIKKVDCSPSQMIQEVVSMLRSAAEEKNLQLCVEYTGPIPKTIQSEPFRFRQILTHLVGNAIKFTAIGSVRLVVQLLGSVDGANPGLQLEVIDTGIGIPHEKRPTLFETFSQSDASSTRKFGGLGLGLVLSKKLAKLLGGDIILNRTSSEGTSFCFTVATGPLSNVPMLDGAYETQAAEGQCTKRVSGKIALHGRILLAEDSPDNQRLISFVLKKAGARVALAENGKIAYDMAMEALERNEPYDLIFMDMQMPEMDGYEATRRLRQEHYLGPIVALTAHAMHDDRQKCLDAGCDDYTTKPIVRQALIELAAGYMNAESKPTAP